MKIWTVDYMSSFKVLLQIIICYINFTFFCSFKLYILLKWKQNLKFRIEFVNPRSMFEKPLECADPS